MEDPMEFDREKLQRKAEEALDQRLESDLGTDVEQRIEEMKKKTQKVEEKAESKIPFTWDPKELKYLAENKKQMDNEELKEFLEQDSKVQEEIRNIDNWNKFSRREERFIVQKHLDMEPEEIAEELDRDERKVKLKMRILGLKLEKF